jgi:hypothetical protein
MELGLSLLSMIIKAFFATNMLGKVVVVADCREVRRNVNP